MRSTSEFFLRGFSNQRNVIPNSEPKIFLVIDSLYYIAGENVTGEILLNIPYDYPPGELILSARGVEEVFIFDSQNRSINKSEAISEVFSFENCIEEWQSQIQAGQYIFPFSFKLPQFSPATFFFCSEDEKNNWIKAEIGYSISIRLNLNSNEYKDLSHTRMFVVRNKNSKMKPNSSLETTEIVQGCCRVLGSTSVKLSTRNDTHPEVNGSFRYKLDPDNSNCKAPIINIVSKVIVEVDFLMPSGSYRISECLSETPRATWISPETTLMYEKDFEYSSEICLRPEEMNSSSNETPLIHCVFYIEVNIFYEINCRKAPVVIKMPIHVDPKDSFVREHVNMPKPWEPVEYPLVTVGIESSRESIRRTAVEIMPEDL